MNITPQQIKQIISESIAPLIKANEFKLTLTIAEAARVSGIGRDKLTELIFKDEIPYFKVGTKTLINREMFIEWLKKKSEKRQIL